MTPSKLVGKMPKTGNVLILSLGCGTGHTQVANCLTTELGTHRVGLKVLAVDVLKTVAGESIGSFAIESWNNKFKTGNLESLNTSLNFQWLDVWVLGVVSFFALFIKLVQKDIDFVVSNQPLALPALLHAVRVVNFFRRLFHSERPQIQVRLVMTDLPTAQNEFFYNIRHLTQEDRAIFKLITTHPLTDGNETEEEFWQRHCNLSFERDDEERSEVVYDNAFPVRNGFKQVAKQMTPPQQLALQGNKPEEIFTHHLDAEDQVALIMLGGVACINGTKGYVDALTRYDAEHPLPRGNRYVFVCCGKPDPSKPVEESLYHQVNVLAQKVDKAARLKIIPLAQQSDKHLAPLLARSNIAIIKPGGLASMEALTAARGKIFVHSIYAGSEPTEKNLLHKGMMSWEVGNARYLQKNMKGGAEVVSPATVDRALSHSGF